MTAADHSSDADTLRALAALIDLPLTPARVAALLPRLAAHRRNMAALRDLDLRGVEPSLVPTPPEDEDVGA